MSTLRGAPQLRARLKAIKGAFKPVGRAWAEETIRQAQPYVPVQTGKAKRSLRVKNATQKKATVGAIYYLNILDKGSKAYDIKPRKLERLAFKVGGQTVFAKKVSRPALAGLHFAERAAKEALRRNPMAEALIALWNRAAA